MATDGKLLLYKEQQFPNLATTEYRVTSPHTAKYNCFAWAAGQDDIAVLNQIPNWLVTVQGFEVVLIHQLI